MNPPRRDTSLPLRRAASGCQNTGRHSAERAWPSLACHKSKGARVSRGVAFPRGGGSGAGRASTLSAAMSLRPLRCKGVVGARCSCRDERRASSCKIWSKTQMHLRHGEPGRPNPPLVPGAVGRHGEARRGRSACGLACGGLAVVTVSTVASLNWVISDIKGRERGAGGVAGRTGRGDGGTGRGRGDPGVIGFDASECRGALMMDDGGATRGGHCLN
ncbi:hypothetical protein E2C01_072355 [Portunus trituberculatus]|uniref:Uncharacterized protein n=1 Tax=Portunus trituberculatus TaxID=210409 RepID=A0A5B7I7H1_PORTR|nr:hypothetical protein [Portunus trituberculatus]